MSGLEIPLIGAFLGAGAYAAGTSAVLTFSGFLTAASIGFSVGNIVGGMLFPPPGPNVVGARLGDLAVTGASYGVVIPVGVGSVRISGTLMWAMSLEETKTVTAVGGGKGGLMGGGGGTQTEYTYAGTFAIGLAKGPIAAPIRIWANNTLIYDATSGSDTLKTEGLNFRFYPGNETQLPDSLIEADKGAGNVPAHRGLCYIVFDSLPLVDFGNRLPNIQVQISHEIIDSRAFTVINAGAGPTIASEFSTYGMTFNLLTNRGYILGTGPNTFIEFDLLTMAITREKRLSEILDNGEAIDWDTVSITRDIHVASDQNLYLAHGHWLYAINPAAWAQVAVAYLQTTDIKRVSSIDFNGPNVRKPFILVMSGTSFSYLDFFDADTLDWVDDFHSYAEDLKYVIGITQGVSGTAWLAIQCGSVQPDAENIEIHKVIAAEAYDVSEPGLVSPYFEVSLAARFNIAEIYATGLYFSDPISIVYDTADNSLIVFATVQDGVSAPTIVFKWSEADGVVWISATTLPNNVTNLKSRISGGTLSVIDQGIVYHIDSATGVITTSDWSDLPWTGLKGDSQGLLAFHQASNSILMPIDADDTGDWDWRRIKINRYAPAPANLAQFITRVMDSIQVDAGDYDVTDVDEIEFGGYLVSQRVDAAAALRGLTDIYQVNVVETDYQLQFTRRGAATVAAIVEDDLIRAPSGERPEAYVESRTQEIELPRKISVTYNDIATDYQINTQSASRVRNPAATIFSDHQADLQIALSTDAATARRRAEVLLYTIWIERHTFQFVLPPKFAYLDPGDAVQFTLGNGYTLRCRLGPVETGVDFSSSIGLIAESDGQYVSTATGTTTIGLIPNTIFVASISALFLLDIPLLRPIDDVALQGMRMYWAASSFISPASWPAAQLQQSYDASIWADNDVTIHPAAWGHLETALPDGNDTFHTIYDATVTVFMAVGGGTLASVTEAQMANGLNAAAVFKANGEIEVFQFLAVASLGGGRYSLTGLNRGVAGTDTMANGHAAGERVLFIHTTSVMPMLVPLASLRQIGYYRAVTSGSLAINSIVESHRYIGRDKMPLAPVDVTAIESGGDILLAWTRRSRIRRSFVTDDVPVGEATESYSIDIYDAPGTTILRTLTSATDSVLYPAAQVVIDFGSPPAILNVKVYQISNEVGRGFARLDELEVT